MKKQILRIFFVIFSFFLVSQAGNNFVAPARASVPDHGTEKDSLNPKVPAPCMPENVGMRSATLAHIDAIVMNGIREKVFPGCQVLVLRKGIPVYDKCFGYYTYDDSQKVKPTTMYDLASLSKTTGTLLAVMKLYDEGKLKLDDKASMYLSFLRGTDKQNITIKELLFHESGLPAGLPFYRLVIDKKVTPSVTSSSKDSTHLFHMNENRVIGPVYLYKEDLVSKIPSPDFSIQVADSFYINNRYHKEAMQMIADTPLRSKTYLYSCVNFIVLKEIVETISGTPMDEFLEKEFYQPLKLNNMAYLPLRTHKKDDIAPTLRRDYLRNGVIQGYVHDPDAAFLGGVSGNAGLFATARDVAAVYQMLLNNGEMDGKRYLSAETCKIFTTTTSASGRRGLGYDKPLPPNPKYHQHHFTIPQAVYGHTGYTGTCCWVDPVNDLVYVFLSNRTYPDDGVNKLAKTGIRTKIEDVIYQSIE